MQLRRGNFGQEREQLNAGRYKIKGSKSLTVRKAKRWPDTKTAKVGPLCYLVLSLEDSK